MDFHPVDPQHPALTFRAADPATSSATPIGRWHRKASDISLIIVKVSAFLASTSLMALGAPFLFFLALSGGDAVMLFALVADLAEHFLAADHARQAAFLGEIRLVLIGMAALLAAIRLPGFLINLARDLSGEKV